MTDQYAPGHQNNEQRSGQTFETAAQQPSPHHGRPFQVRYFEQTADENFASAITSDPADLRSSYQSTI
jgi:hypothetical protein